MITNCLNKGVPIHVLMELVVHSSIAIKQTFIDGNANIIRSTVELL